MTPRSRTARTIQRLDRAIDAFMRAALVVPPAAAFIAWVIALLMAIQALPYIPGLGS
ncbi:MULTISPECIES: hypothetical protein [unclassified Novosphingobium]|uniref:hypothetical protein n=1 Tax=unclassified Novosphingobium TaxID=2644732 RepID=UPI0025EC5D1D|nr:MULTISPECIES: hypothetical protein [unclassified Novosphingobium]HQS70020.1 hypothetical protein [Novosphingobium sp.]